MAGEISGAAIEQRRAAPARGTPNRRPRELQDRLNLHVFHPLAWRLARALSPTRATPDMVSIAGGLLVVAAAAAYAAIAWPWGVMLGLGLHLVWHVTDGADGDLARITGRSGPHGELVDGLCDYIGHLVLYLVLAGVLQTQIGWIAWLPTIAAGLGRVIQANHYESERRQYQWRVYGVGWLGTDPVAAGGGRRGFARVAAPYLALAGRLVPRDPAIDAALVAAAADPARLERERAVIRRAWLALPGYLNLLRSNHRTLALGAAMLAGSPLYFFVYEAVVLNAVLIASIIAHGAAERAMAGAIVTPARSGEAPSGWTR